MPHTVKQELAFLQTLVSAETVLVQGRIESDKENESGEIIGAANKLHGYTPEKQLSPPTAGRLVDRTMEKRPDTGGLGYHGNQPSSRGDNVWQDFLSDDEIQTKKDDKKNEVEKVKEVRGESLLQLIEKEGQALGKSGGSDSNVTKEAHGRNHYSAPKSNGTVKSGPSPTHKARLHSESSNTESSDVRLQGDNDTTSPTRGRSQHKLVRRTRMKLIKCLPSDSVRDPLQAKVEELRTLLVNPVVEPRQYLHQTRQELLRLHGVSQQQSVHFLETLTESRYSQQQHQAGTNFNPNSGEDAYTTLRSAQIKIKKYQRPWTSVSFKRQPTTGRSGQHRPRSARQHPRLSIRNSRKDSPENHRGSSVRDKETHTTENGRKESENKAKNSSRKTSKSCDRFFPSEKSSETSQVKDSPERLIQHSDTHLKLSGNPTLRKWLRKKNKEIRQKRAEERKLVKEELARKQEERKLKEEYFKDSDKKVREWMLQKRKEAKEKAKMQKKIEREEEKLRQEREEQRNISVGLKLQKMQMPIKIESHLKELGSSLSAGVKSGTGKPEEKAQPITGSVRLMKWQQKQKEETDHDKKVQEETSRKMRMSYDQWLLKKREGDEIKRQEVTRQKELARSDPELERILPDLARKRIDNILRGKKKLDTGIPKFDSEINTSFGGADFDSHGEGHKNMKQARMEISEKHKEIKLRSSSARPSLTPKESKSPRRPVAGKPDTPSLSREESAGSSLNSKKFTVPFPPSHGAPKFIIAAQKKLFSSDVINRGDEQQPDELNKAESPKNVLLNTVESIRKIKMMLAREENLTVLKEKQQKKGKENKTSMNDNLSGSKVLNQTESASNYNQSFFITDGNLNIVQLNKISDKHPDTRSNNKKVEQLEKDSILPREISDGSKTSMKDEHVQSTSMDTTREHVRSFFSSILNETSSVNPKEKFQDKDNEVVRESGQRDTHYENTIKNRESFQEEILIKADTPAQHNKGKDHSASTGVEKTDTSCLEELPPTHYNSLAHESMGVKAEVIYEQQNDIQKEFGMGVNAEVIYEQQDDIQKEFGRGVNAEVIYEQQDDIQKEFGMGVNAKVFYEQQDNIQKEFGMGVNAEVIYEQQDNIQKEFGYQSSHVQEEYVHQSSYLSDVQKIKVVSGGGMETEVVKGSVVREDTLSSLANTMKEDTLSSFSSKDSYQDDFEDPTEKLP